MAAAHRESRSAQPAASWSSRSIVAAGLVHPAAVALASLLSCGCAFLLNTLMSQQSVGGAVSSATKTASKPSASRGLVLGKRAARPPRPSSNRAQAASAARAAAALPAETADEDAEHKQDKDSVRKDGQDALQQEEDADDAEEKDNDGDRVNNSSDDDADGEILIDINTKRERQRQQDSRRKRHKTAHSSSHAQTADSNSAVTARDEKQDEQEEMINVEFGLFDPLSIDALTFRLLLKDLVPEHLLLPSATAAASSSSSSSASASPPRSAFALHEFCSLLAEQAVVGTTIKADGTDEPLGFISLVPLFARSASLPPAVQQLVSYLLSSVPSSHAQRLSALLPVLSRSSFSSSPPPRTALLVQARLVNVPIPLIGPLHRALLEDVAWAQQQPEAGDDWRLQRVLLLGRCSSVSGRMKGAAAGGGELWQRWEEEVYLRESDWACRWRVAVRRDEDGEEEGGAGAGDAATRRSRDAQLAVLMCLTWEGMQRAVQQIEQMASGA